MATIELAVKAVFQGRQQLVSVADAVRKLREEIEKSDSVGAASGSGALQRFQEIKQAANSLTKDLGGNTQVVAEALDLLAQELSESAVAAGQLDDKAKALQLDAKAMEAKVYADALREVAAGAREATQAQEGLQRKDVLQFLDMIPDLNEKAAELGIMSAMLRESGAAAMTAGAGFNTLNSTVKELNIIQGISGEFVRLADAFQLDAVAAAEMTSNLVGVKIALQEFDQVAKQKGPAQLQKDFQITIQSLRELANEARLAASQQALLGNEKRATELQTVADLYDRQKDSLINMRNQLTNAGEVLGKFTQQDIFERLRGKKGPEQILSELKLIREEGQKTIRQGFEGGDLSKILFGQQKQSLAEQKVKEFQDIAIAAGASKKTLLLYKDAVAEIDNAHRATTQSAGLFLKQLNLIGFSIFITISSIRTVIGLFKDFGKVIENAANQLAKLQAFNAVMRQFGQSGIFLSEGLKQASGGLIDLQSTQESTLRLLKAGIPEFEKTSIMLARLATNSAKVSGDLSKVNEIYEKLVKGIVRGSPRLIDDADIVLKLGNAYEKYAESVGKSVDELSEREQQLAVVSALEEEAIRMEELASAVGDLPTEPIQRLKNDLAEFGRTAQRVGGILVNELLRQVYAVDSASKQLTVDEALKQAEQNAKNFEQALERVKFVLEGGSIEAQYKALDDLVNLLPPAQKALFQIGTVITLVVRAFGLLNEAGGKFLDAMFLWPQRVGQALNESLLQGISALDAFKLVALQVKEKWLEVRDAIPGGEDVSGKLADTRAEIDKLEASIDATAAAARPLGETLHEVGEQTEADWTAATEALKKFFHAFGEAETVAAAQDVLRAMGIQVDEVAQKFNAVSPGTFSWIDDRIAELQSFLGAEGKFARDSQKVWRDYAEQIFEINQDLNERLADLFTERGEKNAKIEADFLDTMNDIDEDYNDKKDDIEDDFRKRRDKENEKFHKKEREDEEKHQDAINKILRRFELARLKALIDRDARALFEAEERKRQELKDAEEQAKKDRERAKQDHKDKLDDLDEEEKERLDKLSEEAEKRREQAREDRQKELDELQKWYDDTIQEEKDAAEKRRNEAKLSATKRIRDLQESLDEQAAIEDANNILRKLQEARELAEREGNTEDFRDTIKTINQELQDWLNLHPLVYPPIVFDNALGGITGLPLPGGNGNGGFPSGIPLPPGTAPPPSGNGDNAAGGQGSCIRSDSPLRAGQGGLCTGGSTPLYCASDGSFWRCVGGHWTWLYGGQGSGSLYEPPKVGSNAPLTTNANTTTSYVQPGFASPQSQDQTLTVVLATDDAGLNAILDGTVNAAYVDLMNSTYLT